MQHALNAPFESARGTGEGGRKRGITGAGRVWQQQGENGIVGHVPRYRMVRFGGHPTQVEGAGRDTVKNLSYWQIVILHRPQELTVYKSPLSNGTRAYRFPDSQALPAFPETWHSGFLFKSGKWICEFTDWLSNHCTTVKRHVIPLGPPPRFERGKQHVSEQDFADQNGTGPCGPSKCEQCFDSSRICARMSGQGTLPINWLARWLLAFYAITQAHTGAREHTHTHTHTFVLCVWVWEFVWLFEKVSACTNVHEKSWYQCRFSLSLCLFVSFHKSEWDSLSIIRFIVHCTWKCQHEYLAHCNVKSLKIIFVRTQCDR